MLTEKGSSVFIGSPVRLIPRSVSHHRPGVRDDQPFQYDTNDWFSIENESLLLCSLAVISLRIPWEQPGQGLISERRASFDGTQERLLFLGLECSRRCLRQILPLNPRSVKSKKLGEMINSCQCQID